MTVPGLRRRSPSAERNAPAIQAELLRLLPAEGRLLEIAAGSGQHAAAFAAALPGWQWQPSDPDADALGSIAAWRAHAALPNLLAPVTIDVRADDWAGLAAGTLDAIFCANMLHIAPWSACEGLMRGAGRLLRAGGLLITYGPYRIAGEPFAPSNAAFDADLKSRDPAWGIRDLDAVQAEAGRRGLTLAERVAMPANNQLLVFVR